MAVKHRITRAVGNTPLITTVNKLIDNDKASTPIDTKDVTWDRQPNGFKANISFPSSKLSGSALTVYMVHAVKDDHLICYPITDNGDGTFSPDTNPDNVVYIAKPFELRKTGWDGQTINGITYTFPDANDSTKRHAVQGAQSEDQRIVPYYVEDFSLIYAQTVSGPLDLFSMTVETDPGPPPVTEPIILIDTNNGGRAWAV